MLIPRVVFAALACGFLLAMPQARAQTINAPYGKAYQAGSVESQVQDAGGRPIVGARVQVAGSDVSTHTDNNGRFVLDGVPAGTHSLVITHDDIARLKVTDVVVRPGTKATLGKIQTRSVQDGVTQLDEYMVSANKLNGVMQLDRYDVYGQRAKAFSGASIDVTRTEDDALSFTVFNARDIELSGANNLEEFFRTRLVQNFSSVIPEERGGTSYSSGTGSTDVDFRGWGTSEVVILVNGRRLPGRMLAGSDSAPNLGNFRGIPVGSIERIEVLPSAGSAIYGDGATGGVINIITRQDYRGGQLTVGYETPWDGAASKLTTSVNYGMPLKYGFSLRLAAGYGKTQALSVEDRASVMSQRWSANILARDPARLSGQFSLPKVGATTNIRGLDASFNAVPLFGPGTSTYTSVPDGYTGGQGITPFLNRQGVYNRDLAEGSADPYYSRNATIGTNAENTHFLIGIDKDLGSHWKLSMEYNQTRSVLRGVASYMEFDLGSAGLVVPAAAAINPFNQPVRVTFDDIRMNRPEMGDRGVSNTVTQLVATLRGVHGEWRSLLDFSYTHNRDLWDYGAFSAPIGGWQNAFMTGTYNPFVDMRVVAPAAPSFYEDYVRTQSDYNSSSRNYQASAKVSGPLLRLPAGPVVLTGGAELVRNERYRADWILGYIENISGKPVAALPGEPFRNFAGDNSPSRLFEIQSTSAYAEMNVPVLSRKQGIPLVDKLEVFASGRLNRQERDGFSFAGLPISYESKPTLYAAGLRYDALEGITFRGSRSVGFKPATLTSGVVPGNPPTNSATVTDRRTNLPVVLAPTQYITGGNPDLKPETTTSTNLGIVLQPVWLRGVRVSFDYLENVRNNAITSFGLQGILDLESDPAVAPRVQRNAAGAITFLDARSMNLRRTIQRSADVTIDYWRENVFGGRLVLTASAAKNISFKVQTTAAGSPVEQVRNPTSAFSQQLEWNANGQVRWEGRRWSYGWGTRFLDDVLTRPTDYLAQGADRAEWALDHDAFVSYRVGPQAGDGWKGALLRDTSITIGVKNIFDREPRFWAASTNYGYLTYDSVMGRNVWIQLRRNF